LYGIADDRVGGDDRVLHGRRRGGRRRREAVGVDRGDRAGDRAGGAGETAPTWPGAGVGTGGVGVACWVATRVSAVGAPYAAPPVSAIASDAHAENPASTAVIVNRARALTS
jgi:hypothetical protein